jgi:hypothetical protein
MRYILPVAWLCESLPKSIAKTNGIMREASVQLSARYRTDCPAVAGILEFGQGGEKIMVGISSQEKDLRVLGVSPKAMFFSALPPQNPPISGALHRPAAPGTEAQKTKNPLGSWPCGLLRTSLEVFMVRGRDSIILFDHL